MIPPYSLLSIRTPIPIPINMINISFTSILHFILLSYTMTQLLVISICIPILYHSISLDLIFHNPIYMTLLLDNTTLLNRIHFIPFSFIRLAIIKSNLSRINHSTLVPIESLIGIEFDPSNPSFISIIGIITRNPSNPDQFFIQDQHAHIPIDLSNTVSILIPSHSQEFQSGFFNEGMIVIALGIFQQSVFYAHTLSHPPPQPRSSSLALLKQIDYLDVPQDSEVSFFLFCHSETTPVSTTIIHSSSHSHSSLSHLSRSSSSPSHSLLSNRHSIVFVKSSIDMTPFLLLFYFYSLETMCLLHSLSIHLESLDSNDYSIHSLRSSLHSLLSSLIHSSSSFLDHVILLQTNSFLVNLYHFLFILTQLPSFLTSSITSLFRDHPHQLQFSSNPSRYSFYSSSIQTTSWNTRDLCV